MTSPLSPQERAQKIAERMWSVRFINPRSISELIDIIAAQIAEAEREAEKRVFDSTYWGPGLKEQYAEGFRAAREKAAEIVSEEPITLLKALAERIRSMEP